MAEKTFIDALEEKYADCDVATSDTMFVMKNMDVAGSKGNVRVPREMSLHRLGVTCAGDTDRIKDVCGQVSSLDLTCNQLTEWKEIFTILSCMPQVRFLNVSENPLSELLVDPAGENFPNITQLALNSTSIPLPTVEVLLQIMPNVTELHLCMNGYSTLEHSATHPNVSTLYLNANKLSDFTEILKLSSAYPNLHHLLLMKNPVTSLPEADQLQTVFTKMEVLNITETAIDKWTELEKLRYFPTLTDIRMKSLPLFKDMEEKLRRQFIVSYLPNLAMLNMSAVDGEERLTAERRFIRYFAKEEEKPSRCLELQEKHGELDALVDIDFSQSYPNATVQIRYLNKCATMTVNLGQTTKEFKKTVAKEVVHLPPSKFCLFQEKPGEEVKNLKRSRGSYLYRLYVEDGDIFHCEPELTKENFDKIKDVPIGAVNYHVRISEKKKT